ncbi:RcnB family protein [Lysobacter solisilvae (ex Woo and Kim 2020)]|uniref:RcnB family protein n=1 Tax=Agrilutibacter terrestris TaxID=2865112 RepID=A0A7H0G073_9GAMM|nr:RcnB family protein [Lysobacter terrestris]QNP41689.1 RcnB family protein [Lysobacter terrestris]
MKRQALITAALLLAFTAPAFADKGRKHEHPPGHTQADGRHDNGRHLGWQKQAWKRGDRIVLVEVEPRYYIDDYRMYRLDAPPRGYRWIRPMDDRYLLVEVATGLIVQALGY